MTNDPSGPAPRPRWHRIGFALTLVWFVVVLAVTRGDRSHPLHEVIFTAPLAVWILAIVVDRVLARRK